MLENKKVEGYYYSEYIVAWRNMGGEIYKSFKGHWKEGSFQDWLHSWGLNDNEIYDCVALACYDGVGLEEFVERFMRSHGYAKNI